MKIVNCIDAVLEDGDVEEIIHDLIDVLKKCDQDAKIFIHKLERTVDELVDKGLVYSSTVKEVLLHTLQQHDQP